jgi:hypothetical protein
MGSGTGWQKEADAWDSTSSQEGPAPTSPIQHEAPEAQHDSLHLIVVLHVHGHGKVSIV